MEKIPVLSPESLEREPRAGDVYEVTTWLQTISGVQYNPGDRLLLVAPTQSAPFGFFDVNGGNWEVQTMDDHRSIWSSIRLLISFNHIRLIEERHDNLA